MVDWTCLFLLLSVPVIFWACFRSLQNSTFFLALATLTLAIGSTGPLFVVNATLFTTNLAWNKDRVLADFTAVAATWTGSTAKVVVWSAPMMSPSGQPFVESQLLLWICTAAPVSTVPNYGVFYDDGTHLLGADYFPVPVGITNHYDSCQWIASAP